MAAQCHILYSLLLLYITSKRHCSICNKELSNLLVISFLACFYSCLAEKVTRAAKHPKQNKKHRSKRRRRIITPQKRRKTHTQVWGAALTT